MDVFNLAAQITLNSRQFEDALGKSEGSLANLGKSIIKTQALVKGLELGFNTMKNLVSGGIDAYANYEQLIGGVDTLFKSGSEKVKEYAKQAYTTAGLSANQYMETVTSFSASLIQGLEENAKKAAGTTKLTSEQLAKLYGDAADVADIAIRDMADNANKMGTNMESIQNAYQGFAKGNFTMLDNLKLGYGGTKTEMIRLINDSGVLNKRIKSLDEVTFDQMIMAIHAVQQELGITGTTAEEAASTITGSKSSMMAAFQNLLTFATEGTDSKQIQESQDAFVTSFATYFNKNLAPRIVAGLNGTTDVVDAVVKAVLSIDEETLQGFVDGALNGATGLVTGLTKLTGWVFEQIGNVFTNPTITEDDSRKFGQAVGDFIGTFVREGVAHLPETISGLFTLGVNLADGLLQGLYAGLFGTGADSITGEIKAVDDEMQKAIDEANSKEIKATGLITWLEDLQEQYGDAAANMPEWEEAMRSLIGLEDDYYYFFDEETKRLNTSTQAMKDYTREQRNMAVQNAKNQALGDKQKIVDELEANRANAEATITSETYTQQAALNAAIVSLNKVIEEWGVEGQFNAGMTAEEFANVVKEIYGGDEWEAEQWKGIYEDNGNALNFEMLQDFINALKLGAFEFDNDELNAEIETQKKAYEESKKKIEDANDTIKQTDDDLVSARASLQIAKDALELWAAAAQEAAQEASIASSNTPEGRPSGTGHGGAVFEPELELPGHATGLDRVPYDGYIAQLHRGEAILTSAEADNWRRGSGNGIDYTQMASAISAAIIEGMGRIGFYFDRDQVAAAVTQKVSQNIADGMAAWGNA